MILLTIGIMYYTIIDLFFTNTVQLRILLYNNITDYFLYVSVFLCNSITMLYSTTFWFGGGGGGGGCV